MLQIAKSLMQVHVEGVLPIHASVQSTNWPCEGLAKPDVPCRSGASRMTFTSRQELQAWGSASSQQQLKYTTCKLQAPSMTLSKLAGDTHNDMLTTDEDNHMTSAEILVIWHSVVGYVACSPTAGTCTPDTTLLTSEEAASVRNSASFRLLGAYDMLITSVGRLSATRT